MTMTQDRPTETDAHTSDVRALFAYGTLRPNGSRDLLAWRAETVQRSILEGWRLYGQTAPFPYAIESAGGRVIGDVFTFTAEEWPHVLDLCDSIEGYPDFYTRQIVTVATPSGRLRRAWVYTPTTAYAQRAVETGEIASGDWFAR